MRGREGKGKEGRGEGMGGETEGRRGEERGGKGRGGEGRGVNICMNTHTEGTTAWLLYVKKMDKQPSVVFPVSSLRFLSCFLDPLTPNPYPLPPPAV